MLNLGRLLNNGISNRVLPPLRLKPSPTSSTSYKYYMDIFSKIKIQELVPWLQKDRGFDVNFTLDGEWYQFIYYPNDPLNSWFSDLPDELSGEDEDVVRDKFLNLVKNYQLKKSLSSNTAKTFSDIIDEL
jgi:hypothetical protein